MSELKVYVPQDGPYGLVPEEGGAPVEEETCYLKTESDKVIAELKKERDWLAKDRAQAYDDLEKRAQLNIKQEESIRHHKYKRCSAMAKWCASRSASWCLDPADEQLHKSEFYDRWKKRWKNLAEKFKEAK